MTLKMLGRALILSSLLSFFPGVQAHSVEIDLKDYWVNNLGQWSRFAFTYPPGFPGFTTILTVENSGDFSGKYRLGDYLTPDPSRFQWVIYDWGATKMNLYATPDGTFDPPIQFPRFLPLNKLLDNPLEADVAWYLIRLDSLTVPAGTFQDVLLWFNLDKDTKPNSVNAQYGLSGLPYGICGGEWYGRGVGELQELSVDGGNGETRSLFVLQAYGFNTPLPPYLLLLN